MNKDYVIERFCRLQSVDMKTPLTETYIQADYLADVLRDAITEERILDDDSDLIARRERGAAYLTWLRQKDGRHEPA